MRQFFQDLAVSGAGGSGRWRQGLPYSLVMHAVVLGALIVVPLLGEEPLPLTERNISITDIWHVMPPSGGGGGGGRATPLQASLRRAADPAAAPRRLAAPVAPDDTAGADSPLEPETRGGFCLDNECEQVGTGDGSGGGPGKDGDPSDASPVRVVRAHVDVQPPAKVHDLAPVYPELARRIGVQGVVIIECMIAPNGRVADARVLSGHPLLDQAALEAVNQWVYTPTRVNGVPVAVLMTVTVKFHLRS